MSKSFAALRYYFPPSLPLGLKFQCDLCVYGGNSGGVIAAIAAKRRGLNVVLLEPGRHLGGLTAGGLGLTDIGNKPAIGGLSREFFRRVGKAYGVEEHWRFEPHVAEAVFRDWLIEEGITCHFESFLAEVEMHSGRIHSLATENGIIVQAGMFIDASYEGDLMARASVTYTVGRESNSQYGETKNGSQVLYNHQFHLHVDPYRVEGDSSSGLLPGIDTRSHVVGQGDKCIQAYNFRLCLTNRDSNRRPFTEPENYDPSRYELLARYYRAGFVPKLSKFDSLVNDKVDTNNHGPVSTDYIGMSHEFPEASYQKREEIFQAHVEWIKGLLWFWSQDPNVPAAFREIITTWGWTKDEFVETGGFPHALYVREARRLVGEVVMTEAHCRGLSVEKDSVALEAYPMDSHNCRRVVIDGSVKNECNVEEDSGPPYPISYRAIIPRRGECKNLFIPFALSASHIAFGSIRMEPVFMILSESAVESAALALELKTDVQDVPYPALRERLLKGGQVLDPVLAAKHPQHGE